MSDVAEPVRPADPRERLRHGFVTQARSEIDELVALLKEGGVEERDHVRRALGQMADRAASLGLARVEVIAQRVAEQVETGSPPSALGALAEALGGQEHPRLFAPMALVSYGREEMIGALDLPVAESLRVVATVEDLLGEVWFEDAQAVVAPVKPRRELARLAAAARGRTYAWGPANDAPKRLTALADGAVGYFAVPLDLPTVLERIRYDTWRRLSPPPRVHLVAGPDLLGDAVEAALAARGLAVTRASTAHEVLSHAGGRPDLIVATGTLDGDDLRTLIGVLRGDEDKGVVAIVLLGDERDHGLAIGTVDATLPADLPPLEIAAAIQRRLDRPTGRVPHRDPLTGLPNRPAILGRLDEEFARARRSREPLSVALLALDDAAPGDDGDRSVRLLARVLREGVRQYDLVGRLGGGAFLVAMPGCAAKFAARRITELRDAASPGSGDRSFTTGVADSVRGLDSLLARADAALAVARGRGAGAVERD